ncbi:MAG: PAS domain S-box protein [bacterium]
MLKAKSKLSTVTQNVLIGCIAGLLIGFNLRYFFNSIGSSDLLWIIFFILGPLIGYLSGKERQRYEKLKKVKENLEKDIGGLQQKLQQSSEKYRLLVEKINDAIFLTASNGKFLLFNPATSFLSGYSSSQLKKMRISDLGFSKEDQKKPDQYLFENGTYQYDTVWKKKDGKPLSLNIIAKRILYKNYQLILHVAREVKKGSETSTKQLAAHLTLIHTRHLGEISSFFSTFYNRIIKSVNTTIKLLDYFNKNYSEEKDKCDKLLKQWEQSKSLLDTILKKRARDATKDPSEWNLNEIISQELNFLKTSMDTGTFVAEMSLDKTIPPVFGIGENYSMALGFIFKATIQSLKDNNDEFLVSTYSINNENIIEIKFSHTNNFNEKLAELIYPSIKKEDSGGCANLDIGLHVIQIYFNSLNANYNVEKEDNKTIIRIKFPEVEITGKVDTQEFSELYGDDDFLLQ